MSETREQPDDGADLHAEDVSRVYRMAAREEPTPELDAAIQSAATRAVGSRRRAPRRTSGRWWGVPIAVAATVVIGVSIAYLASEQSEPPLAPVTDVALTRAPEPKEAPSPAQPSDGDAATSAQHAREKTHAPEARGDWPPVAATRDTRPGRERTPRDLSAQRREAPAAPSVAPAPPNPDATGGTAGNGFSPAPANIPKADGAPEPERSVQKRAPAAPTVEALESLSPEMWLQRIREFKAKGDLAQADASLRAFRRRYPDYPVPADLLPPAEDGNQ